MKRLIKLILFIINCFNSWTPYYYNEEFDNKQQAKFLIKQKKLQGAFDKDRKSIFISNFKYIASMNHSSKINNSSLTLEVNEYADLDLQEFLNKKGGLIPPIKNENQYSDSDEEFHSVADYPDTFINLESIPKELDWRKTKNVISNVRNQGQCGSCWAFSVMAVMESRQAIKSRKLFDFAEQELVDCDHGNYGCHGGWPVVAFNWLKAHRPPAEEKTCAYKGVEQPTCCKPSTNSDLKQLEVKQVTKLRTNDEAQLIRALVDGPVSTCVAVNRNFQFYRSGTIDKQQCPNDTINHAVNIVGQTPTQWIVRNSWGSSWGDKGYIYVDRAHGNTCNILYYNSFVDF